MRRTLYVVGTLLDDVESGGIRERERGRGRREKEKEGGVTMVDVASQRCHVTRSWTTPHGVGLNGVRAESGHVTESARSPGSRKHLTYI